MGERARWLTDEEAAAWGPFVVSTMALFERLDQELKDQFDITHLDYGLLHQLGVAPGRRRRMSWLAECFGVTPSHVNYRITRLANLGLVERRAVDEDGRGVAAEITDAGVALLEDAAPVHIATVRRLFIDRIDPAHLPVLAAVFGGLQHEPRDGPFPG